MVLLSHVHRDRLAATALCAGLLATWSARAAAQEPVKPLQEMSASATNLRDSMVALARAQVGRKYVFGGSSPVRGFDCSGLVKYVLQLLDVDVPRTASAQAASGRAVARDTNVLRPGDLLMFGKAKTGVSHVGIYVGNGRYIHASSVAGRVIESPLNRPPSSLIKVLQSARRVLAAADTVPTRAVGGSGLLPAASLAVIAARQKQ